MKTYLFLLLLLSCAAHAEMHVEWEHIFSADAFHSSDLETDGHRLYLGALPGIYVSRDHGATWQLTLELPDDDGINGIVVGRRSVYGSSYAHASYVPRHTAPSSGPTKAKGWSGLPMAAAITGWRVSTSHAPTSS